MKRASLLLMFLAFFLSGYSQSDTIYTKAKKKIPCKIFEIGENEIKYKTPDNLDGPLFTISTLKVLKYSLSGGRTVQITPDELLVENQHQDVMNRRSAFKVHPFSYVNNKIGVAYEQVLKVGTNLDVELGYINNGIMPGTANYAFSNTSGGPAYMSGVYLKPGVKFLVGQDYSLKGMKYAHPLKGRYFLINAVFSYLGYQDAYFQVSQTQASNPGPMPTTTVTTISKTANVNCFAYGAMINYGRQFLLGNFVTLEYYIGVGATAQGVTYGNPVTTSTTEVYPWGSNTPYPYYNYNSYDQSQNISNYHGFFRIPNVGISYAFGIRLGVLLPEKKTQTRRPSEKLDQGAN